MADSGNNRVVELLNGTQIAAWTGFSYPTGVAVECRLGTCLSPTPTRSGREEPAGGGPQTTVGSTLTGPLGVAVDGRGCVHLRHWK